MSELDGKPERAISPAGCDGRALPRPGATKTQHFYECALTEAERAELAGALKVTGIDAEIAALRVRLRKVIKEQPEDLALMLRGMDVLRRLLVTRYGLSKKDEEAFWSAFATETLRRMKGRGDGDEAHGVA